MSLLVWQTADSRIITGYYLYVGQCSICPKNSGGVAGWERRRRESGGAAGAERGEAD